MATRFTSDDKANAFADEGVADEADFWLNGSHGLALSAIPWGTDRLTQIGLAAAAKTITLTTAADNAWPYEQEFWAAYADLA